MVGVTAWSERQILSYWEMIGVGGACYEMPKESIKTLLIKKKENKHLKSNNKIKQE